HWRLGSAHHRQRASGQALYGAAGQRGDRWPAGRGPAGKATKLGFLCDGGGQPLLGAAVTCRAAVLCESEE
ncbi:unnamed protein product, partial [Symbiodinium natans]